MEKKRGQGIVHVSDLFKKYQEKLRAPQGVVVEAFCDVVEAMFHHKVDKNLCTYHVNSRTLFVKVPGILKSEIMFKKADILNLLQQQLGERSAPKEIH